MEVWRDIPGWEGIYQASSWGTSVLLIESWKVGDGAAYAERAGPLRLTPKAGMGICRSG